MYCENTYCIYQRGEKCILDHVDHNIFGVCLECVYADIPEKELTEYKNQKLKVIISRSDY